MTKKGKELRQILEEFRPNCYHCGYEPLTKGE